MSEPIEEPNGEEALAYFVDLVARGAAMGAFLALHVVLTISQDRDEVALRTLLSMPQELCASFIQLCSDESTQLTMQGTTDDLSLDRVAAFSRRAINHLTARGQC